MSKPEDFIITSDFATLKNDTQAQTASVVFPASISVAAGGSVQYSTDITAGSSGSAIRCRIRSSKNSSKWLAAPQSAFTRTGSLGVYTLIAYVYRVNASTLRCKVTMQNPAGVSMTTEAGAETIDFNVSTFIPPFA